MITLHSTKIANTPLLVTPTLLSQVQHVLANHTIATAEQKLEAQQERTSKFKSIKSKLPSNTGLIQINGALVADSMGNLEALCGLTSYESIKEQMQAYTKNSIIKRVLLHIKSGGGEAYKCFSSCNEVKQMAEKHGIELIAYVDGTCASAAYAWASIADQIIAHPESNQIGSIGVVMQLMNDSKNLEQNGYERTFVYSGNSKIPFDKDGSFKADFIADLQVKIDETYTSFINHVSVNRKLTTSAVKATQAKTYTAKSAKSLKLVDSLMTDSELFEFLGKPMIGSKQPIEASKPIISNQKSSSVATATAEINSTQAHATTKLRDLKAFAEQRKLELAMSEEEKQELARKRAFAKIKEQRLQQDQ